MQLKIRPAIAGKVVVVTGASAGIGEVTSRAFAEAGARVVLAARRADRLDRLADEIEAAGGEALAVPTDVTDRQQIAVLVAATVARFGHIDVLANIAGWGRYDWLEELSADDLRRQYEVNVIGLAELTRQVVPLMKRRRAGHILNMASYASRIAVPPMTIYASTKYAVEGFSDGLRRELAPWGIHVSRIHPSGVSGTEFNQKAGANGGVQFQSAAVTRVSKAHVARTLVRLVEHPRRSAFVGRTYEGAVWLNRRLPGVLDFVMSLWVRQKRAAELRAPAPEAQTAERRPALLGGAVAGVALAAGVVGAVSIFLARTHRS